MSNNKENKEEFLTIESELNFVRAKLLDIDPNSSPELINDLQERLLEISKINKKKTLFIRWLSYIAFTLLISVCVLLVLEFQNTQYKSELEQRLNNQIKDFNKKDSLFNKYIGTDSTGSFSTYTVNGKLQSYKDLLKTTVNLERKNSKLSKQLIESENRYNSLKFDYDFIVSTFDIRVTKIKKGSDTYTNISSKKLEECYGRNQTAAKKAITRFNALTDSLSKLKPIKGKENKFIK